MYTYNIQFKDLQLGRARVIVDFLKDGSKLYEKTFFPNSLDNLKQFIKSELNDLMAQDSLVASIPTGSLTDLILSPVTTPVVDPQAGKRMALVAAFNDFNIKLIDQATYDQKVQDILNSK